jgi:hypothetical protein
MHVPLLVGPGVDPGVADAPVSTRHVFHTILDWAYRRGGQPAPPAAWRSSSARP